MLKGAVKIHYLSIWLLFFEFKFSQTKKIENSIFYFHYISPVSQTIKLQGFDGQTDIHQLAEEVVTKCSLVNPARLPEIEQLLYYLQNRKDGQIASADAPKVSY